MRDGFSFTGGLDGYGNCYSGNLLGSVAVFNGVSLTLGSANVPNAVSGATVGLPAGQFSTMTLLATAVNGNQASQSLRVNYTDGTNTSFAQSFSDWHTPQNYAGEGAAATMSYRDASNGTADNRMFVLYGYSLALNGAKTVQSITLPTNSNVLVLAITLTAAPSSPAGGAVPLSSAYNRLGVVRDGSLFTGGLDGYGTCYSANLLGSAVVFNGTQLTLGPANAPNAVSSATVTLPAGQFSTMTLLATGVNGNQASQSLTVTYTDGTRTSYLQSFSDWHTPQNYAGEGAAATMAYRDASNGTVDNRMFILYGYSFALNGAKTVLSVTLPANSNVLVLAINLTAGASNPPAPTPIPQLTLWQSRMLSSAAQFCNSADINAAIGSSGVTTEANVWYYDGAKVYQQIAAYTNNPAWYTCAGYSNTAYTNWVLAVTAGVSWPVGALSGWRLFPDGALKDFRLTGNPNSSQTVIRLANNSPYSQTGGDPSCELSRETAYVMNSYVAAERLGQPRSPLLAQSVTNALGHIDQWFVSKSCGHVTPFMVGLTMEALINYYELTNDARVQPAIQTAADGLWNVAWVPSSASFYYDSITDTTGQPDQSLLIAPAYAWLWQITGIQRYLDEGDQAFAGGVQYAYFSTGKQFSQSYRTSFNYIKWRSAPAKSIIPLTAYSY